MNSTPEMQPQPANDDAAVQRIAELEALLGAARDEQLRLAAEFDNQRKRLLRESESARRLANERLLGDLLPVADSLEAGLKVGSTDQAKLREGMELTLRLLEKTLASAGITAVDPAGMAFDPEAHQAMTLVDAPGAAPGSVVSVFQKGYRLHDRLLRPALVTVAKDPG